MSGAPEWLQPLLDAAAKVPPEELSRFLPPEEGGLLLRDVLAQGLDLRGRHAAH